MLKISIQKNLAQRLATLATTKKGDIPEPKS